MSASPRGTPPRPTSPGLAGEPDYDPAFAPAVAAGRITVREAMHRGDREAFAVRLARVHGLRPSLAYLVADNRLSLHEARRRAEAEARRPAAPVGRRPRPGSHRRKRVLGAIVSVGLLWLAGFTWMTWNGYVQHSRSVALQAALDASRRRAAVARNAREEHDARGGRGAAAVSDAHRWYGAGPGSGVPAVGGASGGLDRASQVPGVDIRTDEAGRLVEVVGPDARSVLAAYCLAASGSGRLRPLALAPGRPPFPGTLLGVVGSDDGTGARAAIVIRRDTDGSRWRVSGQGAPIAVRVAPQVETGWIHLAQGRPAGPERR